MSNIKELFCISCLENVDGDHGNATRHVVIHASLFPAFRELKEENEKLKAEAPREVIATVEELDALPFGAIVLDIINFPWQKVQFFDGRLPAPLVAWVSFGRADFYSTPSVVRFGPFTVLTSATITVRKLLTGNAIGFSAEELGDLIEENKA